MAKAKLTCKKVKRAKAEQIEERAPSAIVDAARPLLTIRDWAGVRLSQYDDDEEKSPHHRAVYELPYVRHIEPEPQTGARIDWWAVEPAAFDYWHQAEEVGRTFFEETGRQFLKHGEPIEHALTCALGKIGGQHTNRGVGSGFMATLAHYALIGYASLNARASTGEAK